MCNKLMLTLLAGICAVTLCAGVEAAKPQKGFVNKRINIDNITTAPGFQIQLYADNVPYARQMALGEKGTVFVGSRDYDKVHALVDENKDNKADKLYVIAEGLNSPNGVAFKDGDLYVAEIHRVIRFDDIENNLETPPQPVVINETLPKDEWNGLRYIRFGPDGKLYVTVGAPCNVCEKEDERYGSIMRMNPDGSQLEVYLRGVRNSLGIDWDPKTNEMWFTDIGRELMGDGSPPDEMNKVTVNGTHFGFPYCHGKNIPDPELGEMRQCEEFTPANYELDAHVGASGMRFYRGNMFPEGYKIHILIAEHGSEKIPNKVGYRITAVRVVEGEANFYGTMIFGWLKDNKVSGRPVDIMEMPDGSLLISDDHASVIYRVFF